MFQKQNFIIAFILPLSITSIFLILHQEIFFPLGQNIVDGSGDGLKNLYTFGYYLKYDSGVKFSGLNYPFGEHVTYMDAQPLYVWIIWLFEKVNINITTNPVMYIQLIIILNILVGSLFIYLILVKFEVEKKIAILGTAIIILLSPQLYRFGDHFALASIGVIPFFWWWYINLNKIILVFIVTLSLVGYIHPYFLIMLNFLFLSYEFFYIILNRKIVTKKLFVPFSIVIYIVSLKLCDTVTGRPNSAWGAKAFSAKLHEILLPLNGFVKDVLNSLELKLPTTYTEGHAYITIFGLFVLIYIIYQLIKKRINFSNINNNAPALWFIASLPILMFAFYIPFRWNEELFEPINIFKQFRGTGRFVAVFYYVYLVFTFYVFSRLYKKHKHKTSVLLVLLSLVTIYDIYNASKYNLSRYHDFGIKNALNTYISFSDSITQNIPDIKMYESIIVYPPSTEGTEKIWIDNDWNAKIYSFWLSYFTGLPMANIHSSRVSFEQAMSIFQLSGFYNIEKNIVQKFDKSRKSLILLQNNRLNDDIPLVKMSKFIDSSHGMSLLSIQPQDMVENISIDKQKTWIDEDAYKLIAENQFSEIKNGTLSIKDNKDIFKIKFANNTKNMIRILFWYKPNVGSKIVVPICAIYNNDNGNRMFIKDWRETHTNTYNYENNFLCVDYDIEINGINNLLINISGNNVIIDKVLVYKKY